MSSIKINNSDSVAYLEIFKDQNQGGGRFVEWIVPPGGPLSIDEGDIDPIVHQGLADALRSGQATIIESDLDSLTSLEVKNFLAKGLDLDYKACGASVSNGNAVGLDTTAGTISKVSANGNQPYGVVHQDGTTGQYIRVKVAGNVTAVAGANIVPGDKLEARTDGKVYPVTTAGHWYLGISASTVSSSASVTFKVNIGKI